MHLFITLVRALAAISGAALLLCGCTESIDARQTQVINGLIYKRNASDPFTGTLKNYQGMARYASGCEEPTEVPVKDGLFDGEITCTKQGKKSAELAFNEGKKHGDWRVFDDKGEVFARVGWDNDRKDGVEKIYGLNRLNPSEPVRDLVWKNGKQTGTVFDDGSFMMFRYRDGVQDGEQVEYSVHDGSRLYLAKRMNYSNGQQQGVTQIFNWRGQLIREEIYERGDRVSFKDLVQPTAERVEAQPAAAANAPGCVEAWTAASRKEEGEERPITVDQLEEWKSWCDSGKRPS